ncbi:hypothetical protein ACPXCO_23775 [Streptomyces cyaneofuscatus]|uniref:hypothetical protein n=1 Tax=Streptomyces cyaneofuscatus TaxID=66883 RepID=UPI003CF6B908
MTLPPYHWRLAERDGTCGWVSLNGHPFSRPLLLHPVVTLIAAEMSCSTSPAPES